jgi:hypothetical protein
VEWAKFFMKNPFDMKDKSRSRQEFDINPSIIGINVEILGEPATMHMLCKTDMPIGKFSFFDNLFRQNDVGSRKNVLYELC